MLSKFLRAGISKIFQSTTKCPPPNTASDSQFVHHSENYTADCFQDFSWLGMNLNAKADGTDLNTNANKKQVRSETSDVETGGETLTGYRVYPE